MKGIIGVVDTTVHVIAREAGIELEERIAIYDQLMSPMFENNH